MLTHPDLGHFPGISDRERLHPNGVEQLKNRRVRTNSESQRQYSYDCKRWILKEHSNAEAEIIKHFFNPSTDYTDSFFLICVICGLPFYSYLNATSGSTFVARRAGR